MTDSLAIPPWPSNVDETRAFIEAHIGRELKAAKSELTYVEYAGDFVAVPPTLDGHYSVVLYVNGEVAGEIPIDLKAGDIVRSSTRRYL